MSVFAQYEDQAWPHRFAGTIHIGRIAGGTPNNANVAEGWLRKKLGADQDELIREAVAEVMVERGVTADEAADEVGKRMNLNGFKRHNAERDDEHYGPRGSELYIEGRQLKAAIKEAASCAASVGKLPLRSWGLTRKGLLSFVAEHIFVVENRLYLGVTEPSGVTQRFVSTFRGTGIHYEEYVDDVDITFTVESDYDFPEEQWALLWLTGQNQGVGASRSQGYGRYEITRWDPISK
jgi:hypothetical protein